MGSKMEMEVQAVLRAIRTTISDVERVMKDANTQMADVRNGTGRRMFGRSVAGDLVDGQFSVAVNFTDTVLTNVSAAAGGLTDAAMSATHKVEQFEETSTQDVERVAKMISNAAQATDATTFQSPAPPPSTTPTSAGSGSSGARG